MRNYAGHRLAPWLAHVMVIREGVNAVEAWLSSVPGHLYANVRQPIVHTLNLAHLMPVSSVWAGPIANAHLEGSPLLVAQTSESMPFRLSTHVGDVGHMMVVGPTGAGKSVLLALIALQFRRYPDAQVYIFDKGFPARGAVLAMGGAHHALSADTGSEGALAFQPLLWIDDPAARSWAAEWIAALLDAERVGSITARRVRSGKPPTNYPLQRSAMSMRPDWGAIRV